MANITTFDNGDLDELFYLNLSQDFVRFMQRILTFYKTNFDKAVNDHSLEAKDKLDLLITRILPPIKHLVKILKTSRRSLRKEELPVYLAVSRILESYHKEFTTVDTSELSLELFRHHIKDIAAVQKVFAPFDREERYFTNLEEVEDVEKMVQFYREQQMKKRNR